ncbi:MAG: hypothetical protein IPN49_09690 [Saprospiraceae bacterium]|nr:hypothetical protein [Saprospiraceae bacterium]MBK8819334.1 hypothetical protein [Saprospiraceae bacterium]
MKKLTFSFILVMGLIFTFSTITSAQVSTSTDLAIGMKTGNFKPKDQIITGMEQQLSVLYHVLDQSPIDPLTEKLTLIETYLVKGMLSDINSGKAVEAAYIDNASLFLIEFPESGDSAIKKKQALDAFHSNVFLN